MARQATRSNSQQLTYQSEPDGAAAAHAALIMRPAITTSLNLKKKKKELHTWDDFAEGVQKCSPALVYNALLRPLLLDPRTSKLIGPWDAATASALLFTTFVTPIEVALLGNTESPLLFGINRFVDCIFIIDLCLQFFIMYQPSMAESSILEDKPTKIARHCA